MDNTTSTKSRMDNSGKMVTKITKFLTPKTILQSRISDMFWNRQHLSWYHCCPTVNQNRPVLRKRLKMTKYKMVEKQRYHKLNIFVMATIMFEEEGYQLHCSYHLFKKVSILFKINPFNKGLIATVKPWVTAYFQRTCVHFLKNNMTRNYYLFDEITTVTSETNLYWLEQFKLI